MSLYSRRHETRKNSITTKNSTSHPLFRILHARSGARAREFACYRIYEFACYTLNLLVMKKKKKNTRTDM